MKIRVFFLFLIVGFVIYGSSFKNEFVLDDEEQIVNNQVIHSLSNWPLFLSGSTMHQGGSGQLGGIYYKPMMTLSYALGWHFFEDWPAPYRALQIFLHICNAFLFFILLLRLTSPQWSLFWSLLFLAHPLNTEAVIYIADLQDVLFMFFGLLAITFFSSQKLKLGIKYFLINASLLLSLLSKETGGLFWVLAALYPLIFRVQKKLMIYLSLVTTLLVYFILRFGFAGLTNPDHGVTQIGRASWFERFLTAPLALTHYFEKIFWPFNLTTVQDWIVKEATLMQFWLPLLFIVILTGTILYFLIKKPSTWLWFFSLWLAGGLALHSHLLIPLDGTVADRWFYFPMIGCLGLIAYSLRGWSLSQRSTMALCLLIILPLGWRSWDRSQNWVNGFTLYKHDVEINPQSYDLQNNLGVEYFRQGQFEKALEHFQKSTVLAPHWIINWNNLGAAYEKFAMYDKALEAYHRSVKNGVYYIAYENYAALLARTGNLQKSEDFLQQQALIDLPYNQNLRKILAAIKAQKP